MIFSFSVEEMNHNNNNMNGGAMWEYRKKTSVDNDDDVIWADSNDSDHSFDSTDSDDCFYYTPVESEAEFLTASDHSDSDEDNVVMRRRNLKLPKKVSFDLSNYKNYVLGDEPTKTDMDVFNAICDVHVDEETYPHIYKWQQAIKAHSIEEIQNFPSLSMIVKKSIPIGRVSGLPSPLIGGRRLFATTSSPLASN